MQFLLLNAPALVVLETPVIQGNEVFYIGQNPVYIFHCLKNTDKIKNELT